MMSTLILTSVSGQLDTVTVYLPQKIGFPLDSMAGCLILGVVRMDVKSDRYLLVPT